MKTLTITVDTIDDDYPFIAELMLIANQLRQGHTGGAEADDKGGYSYEVN